jgi:hypothetical protein
MVALTRMIFVALPTYDGTRHNAASLVELAQGEPKAALAEGNVSLLAYNFNTFWADALNHRPEMTHFLMLHSDVVPAPGFLGALMAEMRRVEADVLSVVIPIKSKDGLTSTALETDDRWKPRRLSMSEVFEREETWTEHGLLVNTGLMLVDFRKPWVEKVHFTVNDAIRQNPDGRFEALVEPEDWSFSRQVRALGGVTWATRKVHVLHIGTTAYGNSNPWGTLKRDPGRG